MSWPQNNNLWECHINSWERDNYKELVLNVYIYIYIYLYLYLYIYIHITFTFSYLADAFIQCDLQMRTMEAIKINKRAMICKCYNMSQLA